MPYDWRRYWIPQGGSYLEDDHGFPIEPDGHPLLSGTSGLKTLDDLDRDFPCLVLLGEAGLGKSRAMSDLDRGCRGARLSINLGGVLDQGYLYQRLVKAPEFQAWRCGSHELTLLLDAFDECQIRVGALASNLRDWLGEVPWDRLRLRIACRTHAWPQSLGQAFNGWWGPRYGVFELVPLHPGHVKVAAAARGVSAERFLDAVRAYGLGPLASRPLTLEFLLGEYARGGELPTRVEQVYAKGLEVLASWDRVSRHESRTDGELSSHARLALARRLAAMSIFCGRPLLDKNPQTSDEAGTLSVFDRKVSTGSEPEDGTEVEVSAGRLEEVLGTGLFTGGEGGRMAWSHRTFAEFLAAGYLEAHPFSDEQVFDLFFYRDEHTGAPGTIPEALWDTARWAALRRPALAERILQTAPEVLVGSTLAGHPDDVRLRVVEGLLAGVSAKRIEPWARGLRRDYRWLAHADLESQLHPWITDGSRASAARQVAVQIAQACCLSALASAMAEVALDASEPDVLRRAAAWAVANLADSSARQALRPLIVGDPADVDDELKGAALEALWPGLLTTRDLFAAIGPPGSEVAGLYWSFLSGLPARLNPEDLPEALHWVQSLGPEHELPYVLRHLSEQILLRAWDALQEPPVLTAFVELALHRISQDDPILDRDGHPGPDSVGMLERSRLLLSALVPRLAQTNPRMKCWLHCLVSTELFDWLTDRALSAGDSEEGRLWQYLASMAACSAPAPQGGHLDRVIESREVLPDLYDRMRGWIDPVDLDSEEAARQRAVNERISLREARAQEASTGLQAQAGSLLDAFEKGDPTQWWVLNQVLARDDSGSVRHEFQIDLMELDSWRLLSAPIRERMLGAAEHYLGLAEPSTQTWLGKNVLHRPDWAGARALVLLQRLRPEVVAGLPQGVWDRWTPVLLAFPGEAGAPGDRAVEELAGLAWARSPRVFRETLLALVDVQKGSREGYLHVLYRLRSVIEEHPDLQNLLVEKARDDADLGPQSFRDLLEVPIQCGHQAGLDLARAVARGEGGRPEPVQVMAGALLMHHCPGPAWDAIWPLLSGDAERARAQLVSYGRYSDSRSDGFPLIGALDEERLGDLYLLLCWLYPPSDFSRLVSGVVQPEHRVARLRDEIPGQLARRGTAAAVSALSRLSEALPEQEWLGWQVSAAENARVASALAPLSPGALLEMARSASMRVVRNGNDLLELVLRALQEYQADLRRVHHLRECLWDPGKPKPESQLRDLLYDRLRFRLGGVGAVADREVLVDRAGQMDVQVTAVYPADAPAGPSQQTRVIIEVKGDWNKEVKTAMKHQLLDHYLAKAECDHGVYLVGWFGGCDRGEDSRRRHAGKDLDAARSFFEKQAADLSGTKQVRAFVLDVSREAKGS